MGGLTAPHLSNPLVFGCVEFSRQSGVCAMWKFVATAKRVLWEFVELAFLPCSRLMLIFLLLGKGAAPMSSRSPTT